MATIANTMENQQQQMNKITDIPAGISQFLVQDNLGQNTPDNEVPPPPFSRPHEPTTAFRPEYPPIDRNDNDDQVQQTNPTSTILQLRFCPMQVKSQRYRVRLLKVGFRQHPLTLEKRVTRQSLLQPQTYSNEIQKDVHPRSEKQDDIGLVPQAVHMMKTKHIGFSSQRNIMILWKMDLKYHHLRPQQQILGRKTINCR